MSVYLGEIYMHGFSHEKIIQYAKNILKKDHHFTYSYVADVFESDLLRGTSHADSAGEPLFIIVKLNFLFWEVKSWRKEICNMASLGHYHNPDTNKGLDLSQYSHLEGWIEAGGTVAAIILGAFGFWPDVSASPPINFNTTYQSAADACQEHYNLAVKIWRGQDPGVSFPWAEAMFHLGWACHFIADVCVSPHTVSNEFWTHDKYEDKIQEIIADATVHEDSISTNLADYGLNTSARQLVVQAANETRQELYLYKEDRWIEGARKAIPRAEVYTARLIAKFLNEVGVANLPNPLKAKVQELRLGPPKTAHAIPNAVLFYRRTNQMWQPLITDVQGSIPIPLESNEIVEFRPAAPGYLFEGSYGGDAPTIPEFPNPISPVSYRHAPNPLQDSKIAFNLRSVVPLVDFTFIANIGRTMVTTTGAVGGAVRSMHILDLDRAMQPVQSESIEIVKATIEDLVDVELCGATPDKEAILKVGSNEPANLVVRIYRPLLINTGRFVRSRAEITKLAKSVTLLSPTARVNIAKRWREDMHGGEPIKPVEPDPEVIEALSKTATIVDRTGGKIYDFTMPKGTKGLESNWPVVNVAAPGSHRVTVEVVQGPGLVGYGCPGPVSLIANTNSYDWALIRIFSGNQAGKLMLRITVSEIDAGSNDLGEITKTVELWVLPPDAGGVDTEPLIAPSLALGAH
jgi:hypothetical protein